ncbi:YcjX family protein [Candidatus Riflebacteria bacterium]
MFFKKSIAIVGLAGAGKTVFLTSLLDHLDNHDPKLLKLTYDADLGKKIINLLNRGKRKEEIVTIRKFRSLGATRPFSEFDYHKFRNALIQNSCWPEKTRDVSHGRYEFSRSDWNTTVCLDFLDFPGERIADSLMVDQNFEGWSEEILTLFDSDEIYRDNTADFISLFKNDAFTAEQLISSYKLTLTKLLENYHPIISPSIFSLDLKGKQIRRPKGQSLQEVANSRLSGLSENEEFCPLPVTVREENKELTERFKANYERYRKKVVMPLFERLANSDQVMILVDIVEILAANVQRFNETYKVLKALLEACRPGTGIYKRLENLLRGRMSCLSKIGFIATKADLVRYADVTKLRTLLREMVDKLIRDYDHVDYDFFTCAAVQSTLPTNNPEEIEGYSVYDEEGNKLPRPDAKAQLNNIWISGLPSEWPEEWAEGDYSFAWVYPRMPKKLNTPAHQVGLDRILDFIMGSSRE